MVCLLLTTFSLTVLPIIVGSIIAVVLGVLSGGLYAVSASKSK
jgi:hypothetical protein